MVTKELLLLLNPDLKYRKKSTGRIKRYVVGYSIRYTNNKTNNKTKVEQLFNRTGGLEMEEDVKLNFTRYHI